VCLVCRGGVQALHQHVTPVPGHLLRETCKRTYNVKKVVVFPVPSRDVTNQTLPGREFPVPSRDVTNQTLPGREFPVPSRDVTNQTLPGRELLNYSRPGRVWLVTCRLGTGKTITFIDSVFTRKKIKIQVFKVKMLLKLTM
jgi:hypothetical protein